MPQHEEPSDGPRERYGLIYGEQQVPYQVKGLKPIPGKIRKISICAPPDTQVLVSAPEDADRCDIHDAVMKRAKWIHDSLQAFREQRKHVQTQRYVSGEMQFYLGRRYILKVLEQPTGKPCVKMERGMLLVYLQEGEADRAERAKIMVRQWYRTRANQVLNVRLEQLIPQTSRVNSMPEYRILAMEKHWGSCSTRGTLMLNPHLVKAPRDCIDYVILHELCHIEEHNHGERFYRLLSRVMPDRRASSSVWMEWRSCC